VGSGVAVTLSLEECEKSASPTSLLSCATVQRKKKRKTLPLLPGPQNALDLLEYEAEKKDRER
jgi:hypothetical protein